MLDDWPCPWTSEGMLQRPSEAEEEEERRRLVSRPQAEVVEVAVAAVAAWVSLSLRPLLEPVQPPVVALRPALARRLRTATLRSRVLALADGAAVNGRPAACAEKRPNISSFSRRRQEATPHPRPPSVLMLAPRALSRSDRCTGPTRAGPAGRFRKRSARLRTTAYTGL